MIVDDDLFVHKTYGGALAALGEVTCLKSLNEVRQAKKIDPPDIVLLDIHLQGEKGYEGIPLIRKLYPSTRIIAHTFDLNMASPAMAAGADDFFLKGKEEAELVVRLKSWLDLQEMNRQRRNNVEEFSLNLIGQTMKTIARRGVKIMSSAVRSVYVYGPSGAGKEVVADIFASRCQKRPFVRVNCAAISANLLEAELFGHKKGSFTGADRDRRGLLEAASGGWIFLDEVACLSEAAQAALLRAIENQEIIPVGSDQPVKIDVRVIAASNIHLGELVKKGSFRADLLMRLRESEIELPPLSARGKEVAEFIDYFCRTEVGGPYELSPEARQILLGFNWDSGNIRAVRNCIRAMTEHALGKTLGLPGIPRWAWSQGAPDQHQEKAAAPSADQGHWQNENYETICDRALLQYLERWVKEVDKPSLRSLASSLVIPKSTLERKLVNIKQMNVSEPLSEFLKGSK